MECGQPPKPHLPPLRQSTDTIVTQHLRQNKVCWGCQPQHWKKLGCTDEGLCPALQRDQPGTLGQDQRLTTSRSPKLTMPESISTIWGNHLTSGLSALAGISATIVFFPQAPGNV